MEAVVALTRLGGVASHAELIDVVGRARLRRAVDARLIVRSGSGIYAMRDADEALVAARNLRGALGMTSAALARGWKVKDPPSRPIVWVPRHRNPGALRCNGIDVRWGVVSSGELERHCTDPERTVVDCARFLPFDEALAVADSALREGDVGPIGLLDAAERAPRTGRARAIKVATAATREAANPMESVLRAICLGIRGLEVEPQQWIGTVGRCDLVDVRRQLVIEAESMEHHGHLDGYRRDVRRYTRIVQERHLVLRFCWEDIMLEPEEVAATIRDVMAWWRPPTQRAVRPSQD